MKKSFLVFDSLSLIFIYFVNLNPSFSQENNYILKELKINSEDFSKSIQCVIKDNRGFMWFGTRIGLYRFDGQNVKAYRSNTSDTNSLRSDFILTLYDDDNYLWIGTWGGGLNRFDKTTEQFKTYFPDGNNEKTISSEHVESICITRTGEMWVGARVGLNKFDRTTGSFIRYLKIPGDSVNYAVKKIIEDKKGYLWIGTYARGLIRLNEKDNYFKHFKHDDTDSNSLSSNRMAAIIEDDNGDVWVGTEGGGINKFDEKNENFQRFIDTAKLSANFVYSLCMDEKRKMLWIGSTNGISIFNTFNNEFAKLKKEDSGDRLDSDILDTYIDNAGILWICSYKNGVNIYYKIHHKFNKHENFKENNFSLGFNSLLSFCEDADRNLWIGTQNEGIYICDKNKKLIQHFPYNPNEPPGLRLDYVAFIYRDSKDNIWVSARRALLKYEPVSKKFIINYKFNDTDRIAYYVFEDKQENLWLGTLHQILVIEKNGNLKKKYLGEEKRAIFGITEDTKGNIWAASATNGIAMIDPVNDRTFIYSHNPEDTTSLIYNRTCSILEDKNGFIWVTTFNGLDKFDPVKNIFTHYDSKSGLNNNRVWGILSDDAGNLWFSTGSGLSMLNPAKGFLRNFGLEEGIIGLDFSFQSYYKAPDGEMFFAGKEGFISFYPDSIGVNQKVAPIFITGFKIFNEEVKLDTSVTQKKEITISYKENFFSFDYATLDYTNASKNHYAYKLEGVDRDWNYTGNSNTASYTDISPGDYTFKVKASNSDGVWNEEGTSVRLIITPPWYATFWFRCILGLSIIGGIGFVFRQRIRKINNEKKQQVEFTKKLIESQELERKRVASELHDSLGQDLLLIKSKAQLSIKKDNDVSKFKEQLNEISELTSSTLNDVREISYNLRPYELDKLGLTKTILSLIDRANKSTNIKFAGEIDNIDKIFPPEIEINIYRIIQECLNNIIKHSKASEGEIKVEKLENEILIFISDNGKGFDMHRKHSDSEKKGFGLSGIQERVKLLGGIFKIESERGKATVVKISVKL